MRAVLLTVVLLWTCTLAQPGTLDLTFGPPGSSGIGASALNQYSAGGSTKIGFIEVPGAQVRVIAARTAARASITTFDLDGNYVSFAQQSDYLQAQAVVVSNSSGGLLWSGQDLNTGSMAGMVIGGAELDPLTMKVFDTFNQSGRDVASELLLMSSSSAVVCGVSNDKLLIATFNPENPNFMTRTFSGIIDAYLCTGLLKIPGSNEVIMAGTAIPNAASRSQLSRIEPFSKLEVYEASLVGYTVRSIAFARTDGYFYSAGGTRNGRWFVCRHLISTGLTDWNEASADGCKDFKIDPNSPQNVTEGVTGIRDLVVQPDGKLLVGGVFATSVPDSYRVAIRRLMPDSSTDVSFGVNGDYIFPFEAFQLNDWSIGESDGGYMLLDNSGRIIAQFIDNGVLKLLRLQNDITSGGSCSLIGCSCAGTRCTVNGDSEVVPLQVLSTPSGTLLNVNGSLTAASGSLIQLGLGSTLSVNNELIVSPGASLSAVVPLQDGTYEIVSSQSAISGNFTLLTSTIPIANSCQDVSATPVYSGTSLSVIVSVTETCGGGGLTTGQIVGIAVGAAIAGILIIILLALLLRYTIRRDTETAKTRIKNRQLDEMS